MRRRLQKGESHSYHVSLDAGRFLHLVVDQQGVDLVVTLVDPAGERVEIDGLTGAWGAEELFWLANASGTHQLILKGTLGTGEYDARILALRDPTDEDETRAHAGDLLAEGGRLRREGDLDAALSHYEEALALWKGLGDEVRQARVYCLRGSVLEDRRGGLLAVESFQRALSLLENSEDVASRALALHFLGRIYADLGELERARDHSAEALELRRKIGDLSGEARVANNLALAYDLLADSPKAISFYNRSLALWRQIGNRSEEATTLHNRGKSYLNLGKPQQALDDLTEALSLREALNDRRGQASTLSAMGHVYGLGEGRDNLEQAVRVCRRALELEEGLEDPRGQASTLTNLGVAYVGLESYDEASQAFQMALRNFRDLDARQHEAIVLHNLGWLQAERGSDEEALGYWSQALEIFQAIRDVPGEIVTRRTMAEIESDRGNLASARSMIEEAISKIENLRTKPVSHDLRSSYFATKQSYYDLYIHLLMRLDRSEPSAGYAAIALSASEQARSRSLLDSLTESGVDFRSDVDADLLEKERAAERAINAKEYQRLRLVEANGTTGDLAAVERELRKLLREHDNVRAQIRLNSPRYAALTQPRPLNASEIQRRVLDPHTLLLQYDLGAEESFLWAVTPDAISSFVLPPRAVVESAARRAYSLLSLSNHREGRAPTDIALRALSRMVLGPVEGLLGDKRLLVVAEGALQYIPFGVLPTPEAGEGKPAPLQPAPLQPAPLQPAPLQPVPLLALHEISHMPSASTLAVLRQQNAGRSPAPGLIAAVADPVFQKHDPRLRVEGAAPATETTGGLGDTDTRSGQDSRNFERLVFSRQEAEGILGLVPEDLSIRVLDFEANKATVTSGVLGLYRYVHFATHSDLNSEHPELSRLVLSLFDRGGRPLEDGFLHAHEIYDLDLPADLVVLSACQTALGKEIQGEGLVGLTRSFMYSGASRVIVSLWKVDDRATAALMVRFYGHLLVEGMGPAEALRRAQLSIAAELPWQAPYFWAGFMLQGEW